MIRRAAIRDAAVALLVLGIARLRRVLVLMDRRLNAAAQRLGATPAVEALAKARLDACAICPARRGDFCTSCGCYLPMKARIAEARCPARKW